MVLGAAIGDALGAGYEFNRQDRKMVPEMIGGGLGPFAPGEWTDDTSMTWVVTEVASDHKDLNSEKALDAVARGFRAWYDTNPPDIGCTTSSAIRGAGASPNRQKMLTSSLKVLGESNGSLMRTSPVVLAHLENAGDLVDAAMAVSELTHASSVATQACALWSLILRNAVLTGKLDYETPIWNLPAMSQEFWTQRVFDATEKSPYAFVDNGKAVVALQAALSSVATTPNHDFVGSLRTAIRIGHDTDTVASIAGALVGALHGVEAIPAEWLSILHGYPKKTGADLDALVVKALS